MVSVDRMLSEFISRSDAIGIGPGLGVDSLAEEIIGGLLNESRVPCLYDADALTVIAEKKWLGRMGKTAVVTPHWGEMLRLLNHRPSSRVEAAVAFCKSSQGCLVLKGPHTIVRQQGDEILFSYNSTGGYGLARGGSGDVLAGVTAGLLAQGYSPTTAARIGAWVHGRAADELSIDKGDLGWSLMDLINQIRLQWRLIQ
jgi:NAD(P)H-hydrate epimerase